MELKAAGENFNMADFLKIDHLQFDERVETFYNFFHAEYEKNTMLYWREVTSPADREVTVIDPKSQKPQQMLMFGSNNYLGIANHPKVKEKVINYLEQYGAGLGGPPVLNGNTELLVKLEKKLAKIKGKEDAVVFSSGFSANYGMVSAFVSNKDFVIFDEYSHASFIDGVRMCRARFLTYKHNDMEDLKKRLEYVKDREGTIFVATEGVFSMDGDIGKIDEIVKLKEQYNFKLIVDDAHGYGVVGENGNGVHEHFNTDQIDIIVGTLSKSLASTGGYVAVSKKEAFFLRHFARSYMFSTALAPATLGLILAGLEVIEDEKWRIRQLRENTEYLLKLLKENDIYTHSETAIVTIIAPVNMDIRTASGKFHDKGIFLNTVEFPAVPRDAQRFRISIMATHTKKDLERVAEVINQVMKDPSLFKEQKQ